MGSSLSLYRFLGLDLYNTFVGFWINSLGVKDELFKMRFFLTQQVNPLNANPLNGLEAVTDTFSGFAKTVNVVRNVMRNKNDEKSDSPPPSP